jgi:hypothetical protein
MRKGYAAVLVLVIVMALVSPLSVSAEESDRDLDKYYGNIIDDAIACCEAKKTMRNSWSKSVRRSAAIACLKSAYFKEYKNELISDMAKARVGKKPHKVNYYLNKRFFDVIKKESEYIVKH